MGVRKKIMDFTIEEAVNAATIGFGEIDVRIPDYPDHQFRSTLATHSG